MSSEEPGREAPTYFAGDTGSTPEPGRGWMKVAGCGGCILLGIVLAVVGLVAVFWVGKQVFEEQVANDLREHPVVLEHIGRLNELHMDTWASLAEPGQDDFVFEALGSLGTGTLRVTSITVEGVGDEVEGEQVTAGTLQLPSGELFDLFPEGIQPEAVP